MDNCTFNEKIQNFYIRNNRDYFPWRTDHSPYRVFVSEYMLQQTQSARVIPKFNSFIKEFPDITTLADSSLAQVVRLWSGLGYNRRAKYLHESAKLIVQKHRSEIPVNTTSLESLPGIGNATAGAIAVYAHNVFEIFVETNIRRAIISAFFPEHSKIHDQMIKEKLVELVDRDNPRKWYWAIVDYGAHLGKQEENPNINSVHYSKQSQFLGSRRQVRGSVIRILVNIKTATKVQIESRLSGNADYLESVIEELLNEGLIQESAGKYSLSD